MSLSKVSIIWLNYNSMKIIDLVMKSLNAILELDYPSDRYELIVVNNGSTDGSFEIIRKFLEKKPSLRKKIIKLSSNLGFTGGSNIGFKARDEESKYVVTLNNDAIAFKDSLEKMVEYAEQYNVGGLNGIILKHGRTNMIDAAGDFMDEMLYTCAVGTEKPAPWIIRKPLYITYADGSYALYRVDYVLKSMEERLFYDEFLVMEMTMYLDLYFGITIIESFLSLKLLLHTREERRLVKVARLPLRCIWARGTGSLFHV